jgi:uncharacterized phage protein (TIGR01671 family)
MREILFRAIDEGTQEWVYGYYCEKPSPFHIGKEYSIFDDKTISRYAIRPETVGQYTGLTDKNGKKIFEGDIVDCWSEGVNAQGEVQQRRDGLWIIYPAWQKHIMWGLCPDEYSNTTVEVIGNIHDNPELIKD